MIDHCHRQLYWFCFLCLWIAIETLPACTSTTTREHYPSSTNESGESATLPRSMKSVERQLLASLKAAEDLGEKGHPFVMSNLYSLAHFYQQQGAYDKAEMQYQRALALKEQMVGSHHPDVAAILSDYAALLRAAGRHREADNLVARAKAIMAAQPANP